MGSQDATGIDVARRALSDPRRVRIWELLDNAPSTAARLANALSAVPNRLYYHLRILESAGLIEVVGTEVTGRMAERVYGVNRRHVTSDLGRGSPQERILFFSSLLETTRAEIAEVVADQARAAEEGHQPAPLSLLRRAVSLSPQGFDELTGRMRELVEEIEGRHPSSGHADFRLLLAVYGVPSDRGEGSRSGTAGPVRR